ncbi:MAG: nitroreductase/quinone reductase family protein [Candidatus Promineifilaceae bacterium]
MAAQRPAAWLFSRTFPSIDPWFYRLTGGRSTLAGALMGLPVIMLTTTGAKSGLQRSVPLIGIPDGEKIVVIASNWGKKPFPSWYLNLRANPNVQVTTRGETRDYLAEEAAGETYETYWKKAVSLYGGYEAYKRRTGGRRIPVIVLKPAPA